MSHPDPTLEFTREELELIGHTADAMSAYMGKPVLAEIMSADDTGAEWVAFGIPLDMNEEVDEDSMVVIQLGGPGAHIAGNRGGLGDDDDIYDCECLWIIQLSDEAGARYVKVDPLNQEYENSNDLRELLPFNVNDEAFAAAAEDEEDDTEPDEDSEDTLRMDEWLDKLSSPSRRLH